MKEEYLDILNRDRRTVRRRRKAKMETSILYEVPNRQVGRCRRAEFEPEPSIAEMAKELSDDDDLSDLADAMETYRRQNAELEERLDDAACFEGMVEAENPLVYEAFTEFSLTVRDQGIAAVALADAPGDTSRAFVIVPANRLVVATPPVLKAQIGVLDYDPMRNICREVWRIRRTGEKANLLFTVWIGDKPTQFPVQFAALARTVFAATIPWLRRRDANARFAPWQVRYARHAA